MPSPRSQWSDKLPRNNLPHIFLVSKKVSTPKLNKSEIDTSYSFVFLVRN